MKKITKVIAKGLNGNLPSTVSEYNVVVKEHDFKGKLVLTNKNKFDKDLALLKAEIDLILNPPKVEGKKRELSNHSKISQGIKNALKSFGGVRDWLLDNKNDNNVVELTLDNGSIIQHELDAMDVKILEFTKPKGGAEQKRLRKEMYEFTKGKMYHHPKSGKTGGFYVSRSLKKHRDELVAKAVELGFMNSEEA